MESESVKRQKKAIREVIAEATKGALAMSDEELLEDWNAIGARVQASRPDEFRTRHNRLLASIRNAPRLVATLEGWADLGRRLVRNPKTREALATHCVVLHLDQDRYETERLS